MKQLEQEKDMLLQGLEVAERLRDWYHKQIATVTEKQNYVEKTSCSVCTVLIEPPHGKTNNLHRRKQRRRSASR